MNHYISQEKTVKSVSDDPFDLLPDDILLSIFEKLNDARSLCSSMSVCKRFNYIAPQVTEISYAISQKKPLISGFKESDDQETTQKQYSFKNLLTKTLIKPFQFISQMMKLSKPKNEENDLDFYSSHIPNQVLKSFESVRLLRLRLPCAKPKRKKNNNNSRNSPTTTFLKWKADFGREIRSCVMIGAKSLTDDSGDHNKQQPPKEESEQHVMSEDELKLRIVWIISCLIAASARHYLIRETLRNRSTIESTVVSDESEQGRLCMDKEGIRDMREQLINQKSCSSSSSTSGDDDVLVTEYRSKVPALKMKMWYSDRFEMPESGKVMNGATLVVIKPVSDVVHADLNNMKYDELVMGAFGEDLVLGEVVRKLMVAKRCYTLEMNSF